MKVQVISTIVLTIFTACVHGETFVQDANVSSEIEAIVESLRASLVELSSEYPEMADANDIHIKGTLTDMPLYGFDYFHNCKNWGKRGYEETGSSAIHIGFRMTTLPEEGKGFDFQTTPPAKTFPNLKLVCWTDLFLGKNPTPGLQENLENLLDQTIYKIIVLDFHGLPPDFIWTGLPNEWKRDDLWSYLVDYFKYNANEDLPNCKMELSDLSTRDGIPIKDGQLHIAYRTQEYTVQRRAGKALNAEMTERIETGPKSDGLIMRVWLSDEIGQLARPQLVDRTYWKLYATELYLPGIKMFLFANIEYGDQADKDIVSKYINLKGWLEGIVNPDQAIKAKEEIKE